VRGQGLDMNFNYVWPFGRSTFTFNLIGTYLMKAETNTGLYQYDCVGLTGAICNDPYSTHAAMQPKWRHLFRASWQKNELVLSAGWRMVGPVTAEELSSQAALANPDMEEQLKANYADHYDSWNYIDLAVSYKIIKGINWTFGVNNLFDKNPPLGSGSSANDYGPGFYGSYDPYGRFVHFSVQLTF
jgi:outer membrane receptor protein involved in Fe transport